jgi:hypothetical protein
MCCFTTLMRSLTGTCTEELDALIYSALGTVELELGHGYHGGSFRALFRVG